MRVFSVGDRVRFRTKRLRNLLGTIIAKTDDTYLIRDSKGKKRMVTAWNISPR